MIASLTFSTRVQAWGWNGHTVTGVLGLQLTDDTARNALGQILGQLDQATLGELCNWPDVIREQDEWAWTEPMHYVNIPKQSDEYEAQRDCPDGLCVTESIKKHAARLADDRLPGQERVRSFAWLCHLVGDLHQPLHCGYRDDRGGNTVEVVFNNVDMNLHEFWDEALIRSRSDTAQTLAEWLSTGLQATACSSWSPTDVNDWTGESHRLAADHSYPGQPEIDPEFADKSWQITQQQLRQGSRRLAMILNAILGEGDTRVR